MLQENGPIDGLLLEGLCTPISADVIADFPGVYTVARVYYETHTEYEVSYCPGNVEASDAQNALDLIPFGSMFLGNSFYELDGYDYCLMRFCVSSALADQTADLPQSLPQEFSAMRRSLGKHRRASRIVAATLFVGFAVLSWFDHPHALLHAVASVLH